MRAVCFKECRRRKHHERTASIGHNLTQKISHNVFSILAGTHNYSSAFEFLGVIKNFDWTDELRQSSVKRYAKQEGVERHENRGISSAGGWMGDRHSGALFVEIFGAKGGIRPRRNRCAGFGAFFGHTLSSCQAIRKGLNIANSFSSFK